MNGSENTDLWGFVIRFTRMAIHLSSSVSELGGIGGKALAALRSLGVSSVRDLLWYVPFRYDDFSVIRGAGEVRAGETVTVIGTVQSITSRPAKSRKLQIVDGVIEDETGELKVTWFNQSYLEKTLPPGTKVAVAGRVDDRFGLSMTNPVIEKRKAGVHTGRIVPVYGLTGSLTMRRLRDAIFEALPAAKEMIDWLPTGIADAESFPSLAEAIRGVHFPESQEELTSAIDRLKFGELFLHQLMFAHVRKERARKSAHSIRLDEGFLKEFTSSLPFELTVSQKKAVWSTVQDCAGAEPMNRLLEGDVGSGKTVVAAAAIANVLKGGLTAVYLAPTEILAMQQHQALSKFLSEPVGLLTRSQSKFGDEDVAKSEILDQVQGRCIVGTHALLQDKIKIDDVALVVVDEQHRFGVEQRHALLETGDKPAPHLLSMTATPIPRSLSLTIFGDLDLSVLREMPAGRKPVATAVVPRGEQEGMWKHVLGQVKEDRQVFVVCPLIDPSDKMGAKSVAEVARELSKGPLGSVNIEQLHGRLKAEAKEKAITRFRDGKIDVLVSTTVVEVGVDIPNASVMVIVGADRFGLAQLHQLRGRVGRSDIQSYCYLLPGEEMSVNGVERLKTMEQTNDGFKLAEKDLELRGPGNIFGNAQSGFPDFVLATIADVELMAKAREHAKRLLEEDGELEGYPLIKERVKREFDSVHLE